VSSGGGSGFFWLGRVTLGLVLAGVALGLVFGRTTFWALLGQWAQGFAVLGLVVT